MTTGTLAIGNSTQGDYSGKLIAGSVGIGTTAPNASALLDVYSTTKGPLPPRVTGAQEAAISSPAAGLTVYNTTLSELDIYDGSAWEAVGANSADAAGTTGDVQFNSGGDLGANSNLFWDNTNHRLGIGTTSPTVPLQVSQVVIGSSAAFEYDSVDVDYAQGTAFTKATMSPSADVSGYTNLSGVLGMADQPSSNTHTAEFVSGVTGLATNENTSASASSASLSMAFMASRSIPEPHI